MARGPKRPGRHGWLRGCRPRRLGGLALACAVVPTRVLAENSSDGAWTKWMPEWMPEAVERMLNAAQMQRRAIFERISEKQQESMQALFQQLDKNQDGAIQFDEFRGMTLSAWAAFQMLSMDTFSIQEGSLMLQEFVKLSEILPERILAQTPSWFRLTSSAMLTTSRYSFFTRYIGVLCCFQLGLVVFEYARCFLGCYRWQMPSEPMPLDAVKEASREEVLEYDTPWRKSVYEISKCAFMTLSGLVLIRLIFGFIILATAVLLMNLAALREEGPWRDFWWFCARACIWATLGCMGFYKVHVKGQVAPSDSCKLLLGNHVGIFELFGLYALAFPSFVSRSSNVNLPLFNGIVLASDAILVDRENPNSKEYTINAIKERATDPLGRQVMIFPEGTCSNQKSIFRFSRGAFSTGRSPVQLVLFKFPYTHFNPCYTGVAVGGHEFWDLIYRSCCQFVQHMEVQFLPAYVPSEEEVADPTVFADNMQRVMAAHLHVRINSFSYKLYREVYADWLADQQKQRVLRRQRQRQLPCGRACRRPASQGTDEKEGEKES